MPPKTAKTGGTSWVPVVPDGSDMSLFKALDPKVQERWRIQRQLKNALLGYSTLELVQNEDRLVFGTWNPRQLQPKQIRRLTKSFQSDGLDRFDLKSVMPIVVPKDSIDLTSLTLDPSEPSKLTELKLQPNCHGMAIKCAGGKHRLQALKLYLRDLRSAQDDLIREQDRIAGIPDEEISNEDKRRFKKVLPEAMKKLQGIQNYGGQWMVAVYDEDYILKHGLELAQHLSRNETKHVYMETEEERVIMEIQYMVTLDNQKRTARLTELRSAAGVRKKADKLVAIFNSNSAFHAVEQLVQYGGHFMEMPEMNVRWLQGHLCGPYGGLLCVAITVMAKRLDLCLSSYGLRDSEVNRMFKLHKMAIEDTGSSQAVEHVDKEFATTYTALDQAGCTRMRHLLQATNLLDIIDTAWSSHMSTQAVKAFACMADNDYASAYEEYVLQASEDIATHVTQEHVRKEVSPELLPLLDGFAAKFKFICLNHTSPFFGLPVLTQGPLRVLTSHFRRIQEALKEVSRWFDPLVDYSVAFSKTTTAPSHMQAAIDALRSHDRLKSNSPVHEILLECILTGYGACLDMEIELADVSHTSRVSNTRELTFLFPERSKQPPVPAPRGYPYEAAPKLSPKYSRKQLANTQENDAIQLTHLRSHATQLVKAMQRAVKAKDPVPLSSHANREIDGIHLVHRTSWGWQAVSSNSRLREFQTVAGAAVLEWGVIKEYRPELFTPGSGAEVLRCLLLKKVNLFTKPSHMAGMEAQFTFADQVIHKPLTGKCLKSDAAIIQNLIRGIERCPFAWRDLDNEDNVKSPLIDQKIDQYLRTLARVLAKRAYRRRNGADNPEQDEKTLNITFRGTGEVTVIPKGNRVPRRAHRAAEVMADIQVEHSSNERAKADTELGTVNVITNNGSGDVFNSSNNLVDDPALKPAINTITGAAASLDAGPTGGQMATSSKFPSEHDASQRKRQRTYTLSCGSDDGRVGVLTCFR